jgi:hypothetical protein
MILATLLAITAFAPASAAEFFPLAPGTRWTYQDENGVESVDEAGDDFELNKKLTGTPVTTTTAGRNGGVMFYRLDADSLQLLGYANTLTDKSQTVLGEPQPIFRIGAPKSDWKYIGEVSTQMGPVLLQATGNSTRGGRMKVLSQDVETLRTHIVTRIGNDKNGVEITQDVVYGKGIGMAEMMTATKAQGKTVKSVLKLVKFEPPKN